MWSREVLRDHWLSRFLFGISDDSRRRTQDLGKVGVGLVAGVLMLVVTGLAVWQGPRSGLPNKDTLVQVSGTIRAVSQHKYDIRLTLHEASDIYAFSSKAGADGTVIAALTPQSSVTLWHGPRPVTYRMGTDTLEVFQLQVSGRMVRSYEQVERSWTSDNGVTVWLFALAVLSVGYFIVYLWLAWPK